MTDTLEREYLYLRGRRVALRNAIRHLRDTITFGDFYTNRDRLAFLEMDLRATERRHAELLALTGRPQRRPAVSLKAPRNAAQPRTAGPMLNRMLRSG